MVIQQTSCNNTHSRRNSPHTNTIKQWQLKQQQQQQQQQLLSMLPNVVKSMKPNKIQKKNLLMETKEKNLKKKNLKF